MVLRIPFEDAVESCRVGDTVAVGSRRLICLTTDWRCDFFGHEADLSDVSEIGERLRKKLMAYSRIALDAGPARFVTYTWAVIAPERISRPAMSALVSQRAVREPRVIALCQVAVKQPRG